MSRIAKVASRQAVCTTCTIQLVRIAYGRRPWFRLVRGPLKAGMLVMGWLYRIDPREYEVAVASCYGCLRFTKLGLKERSGLFRWMNARINPAFDRILESIVTASELAEAKKYAARACPRP